MSPQPLSFTERKFWEIFDRSNLSDKQIDKVISYYCGNYGVLQYQLNAEEERYSPHIGILLNILQQSDHISQAAKIKVYSSLTAKDVEKTMPRELEAWTDSHLILSGDITKTKQLNELIYHPNVLETYLAKLRQGNIYGLYSQIDKEFYNGIHHKIFDHSICTPKELQHLLTSIEQNPEFRHQITQKKKHITEEFTPLFSPIISVQKEKYTVWFGATSESLLLGELKSNNLGTQALSYDFSTYANFIYEKARKGHKILLSKPIDNSPKHRALNLEELEQIYQMYSARHYPLVLAFRNIPDPFDYQPGIDKVLQ